MKKNKNWGGARPGSGNKPGKPLKPESEKKRPYATKLRPDQIAWLKTQDRPAAQVLEAIIDAEIKK
ncbi:MAG: hypothetical protein KKD32_03710 [Proteobacteria bacterium]|nr:hypothetical protein [Pseudomonadota bacterium]MBU1586267.1 hypothetical protein [Pseudomonadota bacterium]MBU2453163.1 hypothetical protein [Pseudomonadota bacterium]MBU2630806.1 hypothetical protein [Pseudomonadota bacterium]